MAARSSCATARAAASSPRLRYRTVVRRGSRWREIRHRLSRFSTMSLQTPRNQVGPLLALCARMDANIELARLHAALDSLETSETLLREVRQVESFRAQRRELRGAAERIDEAQKMLRELIGVVP